MTVNAKKSKPVHIGLSVTRQAVEIAAFSPRTMSVEQAASIPVPEGLFDEDGDFIRDPAMLKEIMGQLLKAVRPRPATIHVSVPGTLLRMVEMPRMEPAGLYVSLSSEAERYKAFDNTEAVVDFSLVSNAQLPAGQQQLVFGAVRSDSVATYLKILKELRVKPASFELEPLGVLRALAGSGVLDGLMQQIGEEAFWGMICVEPTRVRILIWQADRLIELRETAMDTREFAAAGPDSVMVEDLLEEIRRTIKSNQPVIWLTHNMPPAMDQILSSRMEVPFHPAPLGGGLSIPQPLQLPTVGLAMKSSVEFPFDFDLLAGLGRAGASMPAGAAAVSDLDGDDGGVGKLIPLGVLVFLLGILVTGGLFAAAFFSAQQLPSLQSKRDTLSLEVGNLSARERELRKKLELDNTLLEMVRNAKIRNRIYVDLTDDLKRKTPEKVWVQVLKVNDGLEIDGKSLSHQSVINFAKSFDQAPYLKAIVINSIKEGKLSGSKVFDFKVTGTVFLNPSLAEQTAGGHEESSPGAPADGGQPGAQPAGKTGV